MLTMSKKQKTALDASTLDREALVQAILDLESGNAGKVIDPRLAYQLGHHVKPYIDRLTALQQGLPEPEEDELTIDALDPEVETAALDAEVEDTKSRSRQPVQGKSSPQGPLPEITSLSPQGRARWIFMERFIPLEQHQNVLGYQFAADDIERYEQELEDLLDSLLTLPATIQPAEQNDLPKLQKIFATHLLLFRNPFIGDEDGNPIPCTIEGLRLYYPDYFYKRRTTPNWYEGHDFYTESLGQPRWILCEIDYLNCTLLGPERKLAGYAKRWHVPPENAIQKTVLEDVYDRILCGEALGEHLFEQNCNSCTSTFYKPKPKSPPRMVYIVQRHQKIAIHGKPGTPHWRATRRLWPAIFPTVAFS